MRQTKAPSTIAFITVMHGLPWGASEELWSQAACRLAQRGWDVRASVVRWPQARPGVERMARVGCGITERPHPGGRRQKLIRRLLGEPYGHWLRRVKPQLVVINQGSNYDGLEAMRACRSQRLRYVTLANGANEVYWPDARFADDARGLYEAAAAACFVSHANVELTRMQIVTPLNNAEVVVNPCSVRHDASPAWPADDGRLKLACVGYVHCSVKGQDVLLRVLRSPKWRQRPVDVTFYGDGPNRETLEALSAAWGLTNVRFAGFRQDVEGIWAEHHALVLPSRHEGLPLVVVEAMLCRRPCILTRVAGGGEVVQDGVHGFVADAASPDCLDRAMESAWAARGRLEGMGLAAGEAVRRMVPPDPAARFAQRLEEIARAPGVTVR